MLYCLDTNFVISVIRKESKAISNLASHNVQDIKIPEVVRAELLTGCLKSARPTIQRAKVEHVIKPFELLGFEGKAVEDYASIRCKLEETGKVIGPNGLLIAAISRAHNAILVTSNVKEFQRVPDLLVENWTR